MMPLDRSVPPAAAYRLALERPPHHGAVSDGELCEARAGEHAALRNVKGVHDDDDVIVSGTGTLHVADQLAGDELLHVAAKVRRVQGDPALHIVEEKHNGGGGRGDSAAGSNSSSLEV